MGVFFNLFEKIDQMTSAYWRIYYRILIFWPMCFFCVSICAFSPVAAAVHPVKVRLVGEPRPAVTGEPFSAAFKITSGIDAELSDFRIDEDNWKLDFLVAPRVIKLKEKESIILEFTATPIDSSKPLVFSFRINGQPFNKQFELSQERFERLINPKRVKPLPGSEDIPFPGVDRSRADPGPAGTLSHEDPGELCYRLMEELHIIRRELDEIKYQLSETRKALGQDAAAATESKPLITVSISEDDQVLGNREAPITIVAFSDYQSSDCRKFFEKVLPMLKGEYIEKGKVRYLVKDFFLPLHVHAKPAAHAAACAGMQGSFWSMHNRLFESQQIVENAQWQNLAAEIELNTTEFSRCMQNPAVVNEIEDKMRYGLSIGITVSPSFIIGKSSPKGFIKGELIEGFIEMEYFENRIKSLLAEK